MTQTQALLKIGYHAKIRSHVLTWGSQRRDAKIRFHVLTWGSQQSSADHDPKGQKGFTAGPVYGRARCSPIHICWALSKPQGPKGRLHNTAGASAVSRCWVYTAVDLVQDQGASPLSRLGCKHGERLVFYCRTTSASTAPDC